METLSQQEKLVFNGSVYEKKTGIPKKPPLSAVLQDFFRTKLTHYKQHNLVAHFLGTQ